MDLLRNTVYPDTMEDEYAAEYAAALLRSLSLVRAKISEAEKRLALWKDRAMLAFQKERPDLRAVACEKVRGLEDELSSLHEEEGGYVRELTQLKQDLRRAKAETHLSMDYSAVLAELEVFMEKPDGAARAIKELEAETALEDLKRRMAQEKG